MGQLSYADIISSLALFTALLALVWNVIRDFVSDKIDVNFYIAFGEMGNFENSKTEVFADAGSILPHHKFDIPGTLVQIINTGRNPIAVSSVGGKLKSGKDISIAIDGLPKMLEPYEIFSRIFKARIDFINQIQKNEVKSLWVRDTKGKKWFLSRKGWERLKKTADYIVTNKHIL